jgi:hypothetical protein
MPSGPLHPCLECPTLVPSGVSRCAQHAGIQTGRRRQQRRVYDSQRVSPAQRGLDAEWRKLRAQVIAETGGICEWPGCGRPGRDLAHIVPWDRGGPNTRENVRWLCHPHHMQEEQARRKVAR